MKSMMVPLVLLGGLTLGGSALAGDPVAAQEQVSTSGSTMKIAIDPVTGKRRALTQAESTALDAHTASLRSAQRSTKSKGGIRVPATQAESLASARTVNGYTRFVVADEDMTSVTASVDAAGNVVVSEDGQSNNNAQELPSE